MTASFDERHQLPQASLLMAHVHQLGSVDGEGVGLAAVGAHLKGDRGELFGPLGVTGHDGLARLLEGRHPHQCRLSEAVAQRPQGVQTAGGQIEVSGLHRH